MALNSRKGTLRDTDSKVAPALQVQHAQVEPGLYMALRSPARGSQAKGFMQGCCAHGRHCTAQTTSGDPRAKTYTLNPSASLQANLRAKRRACPAAFVKYSNALRASLATP